MFVDECLTRGGSLFTPGRAIWTAKPIDELYVRFVENPDETKSDFTTKLIGQLGDAPPDVLQLAAEMFYVLLLPQRYDGASKRQSIEAILRVSPEPVELPSDLVAALDGGIASYGAALTQRFNQYVFLCEFAKAWTDGADREQKLTMLESPWAFRRFVADIPHKGAQSQVEALVHLVFPDAFEPIVSDDHKQKIAKAFAQHVENPDATLDQRLAEIRQALELERQKDFSYYDDDLAHIWRGASEPVSPSSPNKPRVIHLVVKWSPRYGTDTIERARAVESEYGAMWWGLRSDSEGGSISERWVTRLRNQLERGTETLVFIAGETCWRTALEQVETDRSNVDEDLVPPAAGGEAHYNLWLKLSGFAETTALALLRELDPFRQPGRALALGNRSNPLYVEVRTTPRVWWVNQGDSIKRALEDGYLWAPILDKAGKTQHHWETMQELRIGDIVLNYADGRVRAWSLVSEEAVDSTRPNPTADAHWDENGRRAAIQKTMLDPPIELNDVPVEWRLEERSAFRGDGAANQGYLFHVSDRFAARLQQRFPQLREPFEPAGLKAGGLESDEAVASVDWTRVNLAEVISRIRETGLVLADDTVRRYHLSLQTRGFVILAGVSGSGKTWLAEAYADAMGGELLVVPVAPNWTTNEDLLGYLNPLNDHYYDTDFSLFLRAASNEWDASRRDGRQPIPYYLVLDEMNLARVEYYFAKFLSAMERRARDRDAPLELSPRERDHVLLPQNLYMTGTVNIDETTFGFADKVYDRAQLIEIPVSRDALSDHLSGRPYRNVLLQVWELLAPVAPFAFRVVDEIGAYVDAAGAEAIPWEQALDEQLLQKVLPRSRARTYGCGPH
jgi:hypothetical protein